MSDPRLPEGVTQKQIDNDNDYIYCEDCKSDYKSDGVGGLVCRVCKKPWGITRQDVDDLYGQEDENEII